MDGSVNIKSKTTGKIMTLSKTFMRETRELQPEERIKKLICQYYFCKEQKIKLHHIKLIRILQNNAKKLIFGD